MGIRPGLLTGLVLLLAACAGGGETRQEGAAAEADNRFAGRYQGNYFGDDTGSLSLEIDDKGNLLWEGESMASGGFAIRGSVVFSDGRWMLRGATHDGIRFLGFLEEDGRFTGNWEQLREDSGEARAGSFELLRLRE